MSAPASTREQVLLERAKAEGLLPADASWPMHEQRPWPVVLMTAVGAWFAAVPLLIMVALLLGDVLMKGGGPYVVGAGVLALSVWLLRETKLPLFVEQLAVPGLLVGGGLLGYALFRDIDSRWAALPLLGLSLLVAALVDRGWLRVLLGALAAVLTGFLLQPPRWLVGGIAGGFEPWLTVHALLGLWIAALAWQGAQGLDARRADMARLVESCGAGWLLATLVLLCWLAGMTMLVGGLVDAGSGMGSGLAHKRESLPVSLGSALLALAAAAWAARAWPNLRRPWLAVVAFVLIALAGLMGMLGGALLALAVLCCSARWRLAGAAAVAAVWIVGAFYYALTWTLADKALALAAAGVVLIALVLCGRGADRAATATASVLPGRAGWAIAAGALVTLVVANGAIWQKERLIADGKPVFIALAPVDPRSLMQGDFMRLNFAVPAEPRAALEHWPRDERPRLVATLDGRGVASFVRLYAPKQDLAPGELLIELTPKDGGWIVVTDAWFFREGDGARFEKARFGEFRVMPDGRALLVGMADEKLARLND